MNLGDRMPPPNTADEELPLLICMYNQLNIVVNLCSNRRPMSGHLIALRYVMRKHLSRYLRPERGSSVMD